MTGRREPRGRALHWKTPGSKPKEVAVEKRLSVPSTLPSGGHSRQAPGSVGEICRWTSISSSCVGWDTQLWAEEAPACKNAVTLNPHGEGKDCNSLCGKDRGCYFNPHPTCKGCCLLCPTTCRVATNPSAAQSKVKKCLI